MKALLPLFLLFFIFSCGKKADKLDRPSLSPGANEFYSGYDTYGASTKCKKQPEDIICTQEVSPAIDAQRNFSEVCEQKSSYKSMDCNCKKEFLCSVKIDIFVSGYSYDGRKVRDIPLTDIVTCPSNGQYFPDGTDKLQEEFQGKCEQAGYKAMLVGCQFKQYICSAKI